MYIIDRMIICIYSKELVRFNQWFYKKLKDPSFFKVDFEVNPQPGIYGDDYMFRYKYAISGWFYLNPQPPNTNPAYNKYTNIIKYGNKVRLEYNGKKNSLRVMAEVASSNKNNTQKNKSVVVYESNDDTIYQKWNNVVINYKEGYIDIFLNGVLVGSYSGVAPYMRLDEITTGSDNGIYGGICNVTYYNDVLNEKNDSNVRCHCKTLDFTLH